MKAIAAGVAAILLLAGIAVSTGGCSYDREAGFRDTGNYTGGFYDEAKEDPNSECCHGEYR